MCGKSYNVIPANADSVVCSVDCQKKWQSTFLIGENANNWKGGDRDKLCEFCNDFYTCSSPYNFKHQRFCSDFCRIEYWKENTLHNERFSKSWYEGNRRYRESLADRRVETRPERMVREWLDDNDIKYMQEQGFFRRYFADFFIPKEMLIIEVMGNYWHGNPSMYGNDKIPLNQEQTANMERDVRKKKDFERYGFNYIEIWEQDIYKDVDKKLSKIFPATTTRRTP